MRRKINLLIGFSAVILVVLCGIQYYLVTTTYHYKVEQFKGEIKKKIANVTNDYSDIDSTLFNKKDQLYKQLAENYITDKQTRFRIKNALLESEFRDEFTQKLKKEFQEEVPDLEIDFAIVLDKFVIYEPMKEADTIFAEKPFINNKMYGDLASLEDAFLVRNYVGTTSGSFRRENFSTDYKLLTEDTLYISIKNWETIVMKRMVLVLGFAVFSILTLITLFVIALKALIKQKKIADVKTDFINNITHELKTPLTTLAVSTKILERDEIRNSDERFAQVLQTVSRQNNRLQQLIDQVMTNSLGFEEIELQKERVQMPDFLEAIVTDFAIANPDVSIQREFFLKKISLQIDKFHLTTALTNVLENAVKYGSKTISIGTNLVENQFSISISDDGIGIAKNKQALLFDKFYRVEQGNLHNTKGLGLGLFYTEQIIKAHRGSIAVISDLGKGATFNLRFIVHQF